MIFQLDTSLFESEKLWLDVEALINGISKSDRHKVLRPNETSAKFNEWWESLSKLRKYTFTEIFSISDRTSLQCPTYKVSSISGKDNISIVTALRLISIPFKIYVENARNDKNFINFFCKSENKAKFLEYCERNEIEFVNGGGINELEKIISESDINVSYSFFVFDRDSLPFQEASKQSQSLEKICKDRKIKYHQLKRRCIENYLPKQSLIKLIELRAGNKKTEFRRKVHTFLDLKCEKVICNINMKTGINGDLSRISELNLQVEDVYKLSSISIAQRTILASGFSKSISIAYKESESKLRLNESEIIKDRSAYDEVNQIIDNILRIL